MSFLLLVPCHWQRDNYMVSSVARYWISTGSSISFPWRATGRKGRAGRRRYARWKAPYLLACITSNSRLACDGR